eukprot:2173816-Pyramimonas_sp.AAC.1
MAPGTTTIGSSQDFVLILGFFRDPPIDHHGRIIARSSHNHRDDPGDDPVVVHGGVLGQRHRKPVK